VGGYATAISIAKVLPGRMGVSYSNWPLMKPKMLKESFNLNMATSRRLSGNANVEKTARVRNAEGEKMER
jgi:hypothetical protein